MERQKEIEHIKQIQDKIDKQEFKKGHELLKHLLKHTLLSIEILTLKIKIEEGLNKWEEAIKTSNLIMFIHPHHQEAHRILLKALNHQQKYEQVSDFLVIQKNLFPNMDCKLSSK